MDELSHISDKEYAFALAKSHYKELLDAGVSVYEYTPPVLSMQRYLYVMITGLLSERSI